MLFSVVAVPVYVPTSSVGGLPFLYTLFSICYLYIYIFRCGVRVSTHRVFTLLQRTGSLVVACGI